MPSFIIHEACKQELVKRMNIKGDDKQMVIANLLPDAISEVDKTLPYEERRRLIQTQKINTKVSVYIYKSVVVDVIIVIVLLSFSPSYDFMVPE